MSEQYARRIVARGLTPNHRGHRVDIAGQSITFIAVEHFDHITVVMGWDKDEELTVIDIPHMEEVTVYN